jgi:hypothetical protein
VALALGSCGETEPCVPGFAVGRTYRITILPPSNQGRILVSSGRSYGSCGNLGDMGPGFALDLRLVTLEESRGVWCRTYGGRVGNSNGVKIEPGDVATTVAYLDKRIVVAGASGTFRLPDGCVGGIALEVAVPDGKNPFSLQPDDTPRRIVMARAFHSQDLRCLRPDSSLAIPSADPCLDVFDVSISR